APLLLSFPPRRSSDFSRLFLKGRPPPSLCATLAISRDTRKSGATNGFGWQNITTCPASPAQPRLSSSATSLEAPRPSVSAPAASRSEEHTSELQSPDHLVC